MGSCSTVCGKYVKMKSDVTVDDDIDNNISKRELKNNNNKTDNNKNEDNYIEGDNFNKLLFLQTRIKRFLKKISNKRNNINVNINFNVNMRSIENKENDDKVNNSNLINSKIDSSSQIIIIPSVKTELKDSQIFCNDAFLKTKKLNKTNSNDPRNAPLNNIRKKYPKIIENDSAYIGEWKNRKRDGLGCLYWKNICKYIGEFKDDRVFGFGMLLHENGDSYIGQWNDFNAEGIGIYKTNREASYK